MHRRLVPLALAAALLNTVVSAAVKVTIEVQDTFDFAKARTWGWNPEAAGEVVIARTAKDDPAAARQMAEPIIMAAVADGMSKRRRHFTPDSPDLVLTYFLLLTLNTTSQSMGQFLPAVAQWAVPPFNPATQSLEIMNEGGLLLYLRSKDAVVWRGFARAKIETSADAGRRERLLKEAVSDLLRRLPEAR